MLTNNNKLINIPLYVTAY